MSRYTVHQLIDQVLQGKAERQRLEAESGSLRAESGSLREQIRMAAESRWVKLGRKLGFGPHFTRQ